MLPDLPISSMQSLTSLAEYLSTTLFLLTSLKSRTGLIDPSFLGTKKIGLFQCDLHGETTPIFSQFCKCSIRILL